MKLCLENRDRGKSYLIKLEAMRQFMFGTEVIIIDPEGEYGDLTKTVGRRRS